MIETRYCVLDIETAVSVEAAALAAAGERPNVGRAALHEFVAGSVLSFGRAASGEFGDVRQFAVGADGECEVDMLRRLDVDLVREHARGSVLVTFNGAHDLGLLRRRAARHWLFSGMDFERWPLGGGEGHLDLMRLDPIAESGRWPNLLDALAGYGIGAVCPRLTGSSRTVSPQVRKAEVDTFATALLLFHHLAMREKSIAPVVHGWAALSQWLARARPHEDHLRQFIRHPFARTAHEALTSASVV